MAEEEAEEVAEAVEPGWFRIYEPIDGVLTSEQESAIRGYARAQGYETLRGFHMVLRGWDWDYYDVLREVSP